MSNPAPTHRRFFSDFGPPLRNNWFMAADSQDPNFFGHQFDPAPEAIRLAGHRIWPDGESDPDFGYKALERAVEAADVTLAPAPRFTLCRQCRKPVPNPPMGRPLIYCSKECRKLWTSDRAAEKYRAAHPKKPSQKRAPETRPRKEYTMRDKPSKEIQLINLMRDGQWHGAQELTIKVSHRFSGYLFNLKGQGVEWEKRLMPDRPEGAKWWEYRMTHVPPVLVSKVRFYFK